MGTQYMKNQLKCLEKIKDKNRMVLKTADDKYEIKDASIDLKDKWIFFSPSVIFGVDISLTVSQNVFLFSSGRSINSYQLFQQVCRTRNIKKVYYHFDKLTKKLKYSSLKETNEYYERNIKSYERIHNLCVNMDEELNEVIVKNKFFDIFCFNEYLNNIYGLDKKKKFEEIRKANFIVHTWNPYAGPKMKDRLKGIGLKTVYIPFGQQEKK